MKTTNFFSSVAALQLTGDLQLTISKGADDNWLVSILLNNEQCGDDARKLIPPLMLKGKTEELDKGFFDSIAVPLQTTSELLINMEAFLRQQEEAQKQSAMEKEKADRERKKKEAREKKYKEAKWDAHATGFPRNGRTENKGFFLNLKLCYSAVKNRRSRSKAAHRPSFLWSESHCAEKRCSHMPETRDPTRNTHHPFPGKRQRHLSTVY